MITVLIEIEINHKRIIIKSQKEVKRNYHNNDNNNNKNDTYDRKTKSSSQ